MLFLRGAARLLIAVVICADAAALQAGAGKSTITPTLGAPLDGYTYRSGRGAISVHDQLWARALYLEDGETSLFLVTLDVFAIAPELRERIVELARVRVPGAQVILVATHTHNGAGGIHRSWIARARAGRYMPDLVESMAKQTSEAIGAAYDARTRCTIGYATSSQTAFTRNRYDAQGLVDPQIGVVSVSDSDGAPIAILANLAALPATAPRRSAFSFSADFPGAFCDALEDRMGSRGIAMFMMGAAADQVCRNDQGLTGWSWPESFGDAFAQRVKAMANRIEGYETPLRIASRQLELPVSLAPSLHGKSALLYSLELDRLLITFVPGVPDAAVALALRERAERHGYSDQMTVAAANDYLMDIIDPDGFKLPPRESGGALFGPDFAATLIASFETMMSRGKPSVRDNDIADPAARAAFGEGERFIFAGAPYELGYQRGHAFRHAYRQAYERRVLDPLRNGAIPRDLGLWKFAPRGIDLAPLEIAALANEARPILSALPDDALDELRGLADATELPLLGLWLLHTADRFAEEAPDQTHAAATLVAVTDDRALPDGPLVGWNMARTEDEPVTILEYRPEKGRGFVQVGAPWASSAFAAMNDAGLVVCAERAPELGRPTKDSPPLAFQLRRFMTSVTNFDDALTELTGFTMTRGYRILLVDRPASDVALIEYGRKIAVRRPRDGVLKASGSYMAIPPDAVRRYERADTLLQRDEAVTAEDLIAVLRDQEYGQKGLARILNDATRATVVFEPSNSRIHVSLMPSGGGAGNFQIVPIERARP